ncbi:S-layer homology domain-containing protein [Limnochorda pilosa]|uniref:SLH domain-containing protein n=1 Tax=Limnochorda pilosa TaxID=1555112 RepID=A0A0K2SP13_LIMPI|nr:S-layer homology domain-containing protein [Limnochorda pilosa]BAS28878.1 hypothetical protein LIP_3049 [Limnochorda pilosa]
MPVRWGRLMALMALMVLVAALLGGRALGAPEAKVSQLFAELPPEHWSYGAVRTLSTAGLVKVPPAGFGVGLTVTRLEMALEVGEAMDRLQAAAPASPSVSLPVLVARYNRSARTPLGWDQVRLLERLAREFSPELTALGYRAVIPSPQSFRLEAAPVGVPLPELDAVWLGLGELPALTWSASAPGPEGLVGLDGLREGRGAADEQADRGLALGARFRLLPTVQVEGQVESGGARPGYRIGAGVDLGDVYISGGYDVPPAAAASEPPTGGEAAESGADGGRTRWGLRWTTGGTELTAAYEYVGLDDLRVLGGTDLPSRLEVGVGVALEGGAIRVGWSREAQPVEGTAPKAVEAGEPEPTEADPPEPGGNAAGSAPTAPRQVQTTLKLTYDVSSVGSLTLGYQLIDFGDEDGVTSTNAATAEFTLRF